MNNQSQISIITPGELIEYWQGNRRLTRRVIDAFPEDKLFSHSIGGMRPFSEMVKELIWIAGNGIHGIASGEWNALPEINLEDKQNALKDVNTVQGLLEYWDKVTAEMDSLGSRIPEARFREKEKAFGVYDGEIWSHVLYLIDNEIHHRGQGYVYLRSLDIEPPLFYER